jgi:hypothetical protein
MNADEIISTESSSDNAIFGDVAFEPQADMQSMSQLQ